MRILNRAQNKLVFMPKLNFRMKPHPARSVEQKRETYDFQKKSFTAWLLTFLNFGQKIVSRETFYLIF